MSRLAVTLELFAGGRLKVQTLGSSEFEPGTVLRRIEVRVDGMLLASVPFTLDEDAGYDDEDLDDEGPTIGGGCLHDVDSADGCVCRVERPPTD